MFHPCDGGLGRWRGQRPAARAAVPDGHSLAAEVRTLRALVEAQASRLAAIEARLAALERGPRTIAPPESTAVSRSPRRALGRGLDALIPGAASSGPEWIARGHPLTAVPRAHSLSPRAKAPHGGAGVPAHA